MNDLEKATKARDDFLEANPHLKERQDELDKILDKCRDEDRLAVVNMFMMQSMLELQKNLIQLKQII